MKLDVKKIKVLMAEHEINQTDLASMLGVSKQSLCSTLSRKTCTLKTLGKISKALGVNPAKILKDD